MGSSRIAVLAFALLPALAPAGVLYKSVDPTGVITFSDMPPPAGARILEQREIPAAPGNYSYAPTEPSVSAPEPLPPEQWLDSDAVLAQANAQVDQAERALAMARRAAGPTLGAVRLGGGRLSREDEDRIEREKRNVRLARQRLLELLRDRRLALAR